MKAARASSRSPNLSQLAVNVGLRFRGAFREVIVEDAQKTEPLFLAHPVAALVVFLDRFTHHRALRLLSACGGGFQVAERLLIEHERDFLGCHTCTITIPYSSNTDAGQS